MSDARMLLKACWVFPVDQPPIEQGLVEIQGDRIARVESGSDSEAIDLGDVAIIPGLVNAHTHLEFSHLSEPLGPAAPFPEWIHAVIAARRERQRPVEEVIRRGAHEAAQSGTTLLGEIATSDAAAGVPDESTPQIVAYREVLGLDEAAIQCQQAAVNQHLTSSGSSVSPHLARGLSPHAPYSVHPELFEWTIEQARLAGLPVAMHLAETRDERELLERGTGPLARMLQEFGLWQEGLFGGGRTILDYLDRLATLDRVLLVHGNDLNAEEIGYLEGKSGFSIVYCPRTHAYFGHHDHPWRMLLERGIGVALGTDSRASNPDLNLWREVLFLRETAPDVAAELLLRMATLNGAQALGVAEETGSITPGKEANLAVVSLEAREELPDAATIFQQLMHPQSRVIATLRAGRWLCAP